MSPSPNYPDAVLERAKTIGLVCFDVDGTLTDGGIVFDENGQESKRFHVHDGLGIALLKRAGFIVALVTARASTVAERRARELGILAFTAVKDKRACVAKLAAEHGIAMQNVAFMGDDLVDLPAFLAVGLAVSPANQHPWLDGYVHWQTAAAGGQGAARQLCDLLLTAQDKRAAVLAEFGACP